MRLQQHENAPLTFRWAVRGSYVVTTFRALRGQRACAHGWTTMPKPSPNRAICYSEELNIPLVHWLTAEQLREQFKHTVGPAENSNANLSPSPSPDASQSWSLPHRKLLDTLHWRLFQLSGRQAHPLPANKNKNTCQNTHSQHAPCLFLQQHFCTIDECPWQWNKMCNHADDRQTWLHLRRSDHPMWMSTTISEAVKHFRTPKYPGSQHVLDQTSCKVSERRCETTLGFGTKWLLIQHFWGLDKISCLSLVLYCVQWFIGLGWRFVVVFPSKMYQMRFIHKMFCLIWCDHKFSSLI